MKRLIAALFVVPFVAGALLLSRSAPAGVSGGVVDLQVKQESVNPWSNLTLNNDNKTIRFAIVSDRTGGARAGIFERAIDQLNILQPEFVMSVGDFIQGMTEDQDKITKQWKEFNGFIAKLEMPFFYVPGNHDISNPVMETRWREQFGRRWYHFKYKDVLFLLLNTEDMPTKKSAGKFGPEQVADVKKVLEDNRDVRWTLVFMHRPVWNAKEVAKTNWPSIEELLMGRRVTVFAGHEHEYERQLRNGILYYTFATTGGSSKLRGLAAGEFDHIVWITMKNGGPPIMANLMMQGIFPDDVRAAAKQQEQ
jgi:serine/threonine-protein phosphatase CPPED1